MPKKTKQTRMQDDGIIMKEWFSVHQGDCTGARCSEIRFEFANADAQNLHYTYRDAQGRISTGVLGPGNEAYISSWLSSLHVRLLFPPFSGSTDACSEECECLYGSETSAMREYTHVYDQDFSAGRRIEIKGQFKVRVVMRMGVCIPKVGSTFGRVGASKDLSPFAAAAAVEGEPPIDTPYD